MSHSLDLGKATVVDHKAGYQLVFTAAVLLSKSEEQSQFDHDIPLTALDVDTLGNAWICQGNVLRFVLDLHSEELIDDTVMKRLACIIEDAELWHQLGFVPSLEHNHVLSAESRVNTSIALRLVQRRNEHPQRKQCCRRLCYRIAAVDLRPPSLVEVWRMTKVILEVSIAKIKEGAKTRRLGRVVRKEGRKKRKRTLSKHDSSSWVVQKQRPQDVTEYHSCSGPQVGGEMLFESLAEDSGYPPVLSSEAAVTEDGSLFNDPFSTPSAVESAPTSEEPTPDDIERPTGAESYTCISREAGSIPLEPLRPDLKGQTETITNLIDAAMRLTICTKSVKCASGVHSMRTGLTTQLCELAPGLWRYGYAEELSTRVPLIPTIAHALSHSMYANARSQSLKAKIERLVVKRMHEQNSEAGQHHIGVADDAVNRYRVLETAIWNHIQKQLLHVSPLRRLKPLSCQVGRTSQQRDFDEELFYSQRVFHEENNGEEGMLFDGGDGLPDEDEMMFEDYVSDDGDDYLFVDEDVVFDEELFYDERADDWLLEEPEEEEDLFLPQPDQLAQSSLQGGKDSIWGDASSEPWSDGLLGLF